MIEASEDYYQLAEQKIQEAMHRNETRLRLSNLKLTKLPEALGQLTQLKFLDLSFNQLTELPEFIGELHRLETIQVFDNQLEVLPDSLGQLTQLKSLAVWKNILKTVPEAVSYTHLTLPTILRV